MAKKGRRYEHDVSKELTEKLDSGFGWPVGYSGNGAQPAPDIVVVTPMCAGGLELKKTSRDTFGVPASDLRQLLRIGTNFMRVGLGVKFSNREPVIVEPQFPPKPMYDFEDDLAEELDGVAVCEQFEATCPSAFEPRVSVHGAEASLRLSRPSCDDWPSARSGVSIAEKVQRRLAEA
jgi:Holliday junction resolvase